jgi:hypothetical protein
VERKFPGDAKRATLQRHTITLAREGMTALQCIDQGVATGSPEQFNVATTYVKDILKLLK